MWSEQGIVQNLSSEYNTLNQVKSIILVSIYTDEICEVSTEFMVLNDLYALHELIYLS